MEQPTQDSLNLCSQITSEGLRHYWHPVARSSEVADKPFKAKLLNQPLVLWRSNGSITAFYDLCIHRGTPLSLGWIADGELVCAYHGWRYAANGSCTRIPALPPDRTIPAKARAGAFKAQERYGLIWVCLGRPRAEIPEFPPEFDDPQFRWAPYSTDGFWKANAAISHTSHGCTRIRWGILIIPNASRFRCNPSPGDFSTTFPSRSTA
ncbi:MAG: Rieske 2Fe-2S domain-containing protein [Deltaproteobacteria bacterium]|nr:Rieske 2Fe-2S domain-containing protein [Deltaproteobacteria bacterium]